MQNEPIHRFANRNGILLHFVELGTPGGSPVIFLHGFPEFWWSWRRQAEALAANGFHVAIVDMRGYGQSDAPPEIQNYDLDHLVADVKALGEELRWQNFNLIGHDWGGIVAWAVAAKHPNLIRRLVILNAPHLDVASVVLRKRPVQILRSAYIGLFQVPAVPEALLRLGRFYFLKRALTSTSRNGTFSDKELSIYAVQWDRPGRLRAMLNYYRALLRRKPANLGRITPPVLILWGRNDQALDFALAQESLRMCDDATMIVHDEATHWLHLEEPGWVFEKLHAFL